MTGRVWGSVRMPPRRSDAERFHERAQEVRRGRLTRMFGLLLTVAVVGGLAWLVGWSSVFAVRTVEVEGTQGASATSLKDLAAVPLGRPLVRVDTGEIAARVETAKVVASATVERSWPSTIVVKVALRTPAVVVKNPQGQLEVVDSSGVRYATTKAPLAGVPLVTATADRAMSEDALKTALALVADLPEDLGDKVTSIEVSSANLVTFRLGAVRVVWGGRDAADRKAEVLRALLRTHPTLIDVSAPDTPVTR